MIRLLTPAALATACLLTGCTASDPDATVTQSDAMATGPDEVAVEAGVDVTEPDVIPTAAEAEAEAPEVAEVPMMMVAAFDGEAPRVDDTSGAWRTVNDTVMGGRSSGGGVIRDGIMTFAGTVNTNGGGFASVRANTKAWDLSEYDGLTARVRADGRTYVMHLSTGLRYSRRNVAYRAEFSTEALIDANGESVSDETWQTVYVPFDAFVARVWGYDVSDRVERLDPAKSRSIGIMISDGIDGPFRREADWIRAEARDAE